MRFAVVEYIPLSDGKRRKMFPSPCNGKSYSTCHSCISKYISCRSLESIVLDCSPTSHKQSSGVCRLLPKNSIKAMYEYHSSRDKLSIRCNPEVRDYCPHAHSIPSQWTPILDSDYGVSRRNSLPRVGATDHRREMETLVSLCLYVNDRRLIWFIFRLAIRSQNGRCASEATACHPSVTAPFPIEVEGNPKFWQMSGRLPYFSRQIEGHTN